MEKETLVKLREDHEKLYIYFEFNDFKISRTLIDFVESDKKKFGLVQALDELNEKLDFLIKSLKEDKSNIENKVQLISILNTKKNKIIHYRNTFEAKREMFIKNYYF